MDAKPVFSRAAKFAIASAVLVAGIVALHSDVEQVIVESGERLYVAVYSYCVARDVVPPSPSRLLD